MRLRSFMEVKFNQFLLWCDFNLIKMIFISTIETMSHDHNHSGKNLRFAFWVNLIFAIFEFIGGWLVNSVAIMSDALHDFGDSISLGTAWYLDRKSTQKADKSFSFGYARHSLLGALINSIILISGSVYIVIEAIKRLVDPELSNASGMILFAMIGIIVNGVVAFRTSTGKSMNEKVVYWHIMEDVLGWAAVLIGGVVLYFYESPYIDPILSLLITAYILYGVIRRLIQTMHFFLQGVPKDIDLDQILDDIRSIPKVKNVHHTHVWSLDGERHVFTSHVKLERIDNFVQLRVVKETIKKLLAKKRFEHYTIDVELEEETCGIIE